MDVTKFSSLIFECLASFTAAFSHFSPSFLISSLSLCFPLSHFPLFLHLPSRFCPFLTSFLFTHLCLCAPLVLSCSLLFHSSYFTLSFPLLSPPLHHFLSYFSSFLLPSFAAFIAFSKISHLSVFFRSVSPTLFFLLSYSLLLLLLISRWVYSSPPSFPCPPHHHHHSPFFLAAIFFSPHHSPRDLYHVSSVLLPLSCVSCSYSYIHLFSFLLSRTTNNPLSLLFLLRFTLYQHLFPRLIFFFTDFHLLHIFLFCTNSLPSLFPFGNLISAFLSFPPGLSLTLCLFSVCVYSGRTAIHGHVVRPADASTVLFKTKPVSLHHHHYCS